MARLPVSDPLDLLIRQRFELSDDDGRYDVYRRWTRGESLTAGERAIAADFATYREELRNLPQKEVDQLLRQAREAETDAKERDHPFNLPPALADRLIYEHWSKAAFWDLEEAAALMLGRNPKHVNGRTLKDDYRASRVKSAFFDLLDLLYRAQTARQIGFSEGPGGYLVWAKRYLITYPAELEECVKLHGHELRDWRSVAEGLQRDIAALNAKIADLSAEAPKGGDNVAARERTSMLKLIIGMAIEGYCFDPKAPRNPATSDIASDLAKLGLSLDDATILKYLREAADILLPGDGIE